jgi:hypothetical protein
MFLRPSPLKFEFFFILFKSLIPPAAQNLIIIFHLIRKYEARHMSTPLMESDLVSSDDNITFLPLLVAQARGMDLKLDLGINGVPPNQRVSNHSC